MIQVWQQATPRADHTAGRGGRLPGPAALTSAMLGMLRSWHPAAAAAWLAISGLRPICFGKQALWRSAVLLGLGDSFAAMSDLTRFVANKLNGDWSASNVSGMLTDTILEVSGTSDRVARLRPVGPPSVYQAAQVIISGGKQPAVGRTRPC